MVCDIRDRAAALYLRRGVLASVVIPEQKIADGRLTLTVVEARIASVNYHGDAGPAQKQVARFLDHLRGMAPFDLDVAQRYLLLASDVPGVRIQSALRPSPAGDGALDLDVAIARDAVDGSVVAQNYGSKTVGRDLTLARLDLQQLHRAGRAHLDHRLRHPVQRRAAGDPGDRALLHRRRRPGGRRLRLVGLDQAGRRAQAAGAGGRVLRRQPAR